MRVHKDTPFEFSLMPWELEPPQTSLMVVVKATFDLVHEGECTISDAQVPCGGEVPWDDGDSPSLRTETDYAIFKPRGEWYVTGHAHMVGSASTMGQVEVKIGRCQKRMAVVGDRVWKRGVMGATASEPKPFVRMPLRWERSFGGPRVAANPVGVGTGPVETEDGRVEPLPNFEDPSRLIVSKGEQPAPVGMFAIPSGWAARRALTGTYDEVWKAARWPYFPRDFRMEFFQAAPPDQRLPEGYWRGDETIELVGLHPELHRLRTRLPSLRARAFVEWVSRPSDAPRLETLSRAELQALGRPKLRAVELALDTVVIDADAAQVLCTWRGLVKVADAQLSDVERLFFVHEPCSQDHPLEHYEDWLLRKVMEEAAEFELDDTEEAHEALPEPEEPPSLRVKTSKEEIKSVDEAWANVGVALPAILSRFVEASPSPTHEEYRARLAEYGVDPDTVLPPLEEVVTPPEPEEPRSLLRLAAILRRRLGKSFAELDLSAMPFAKLDLSGVDFRGARLTDADLTGANLASCVFDGALLYRAKLGRTDARRASFRGADLTEMDATEARFDGSSFDGAVGSDAVFSRASFANASMVEAELAGAGLDGCELREANLTGADFTGANIEGSRFEASAMPGVSLEGARGAGAIFDRCTMPDLRASDGAVFSGGRFVLVDAPRAQFQGSAMIGVNFGGSNLEQADFSDASLARSNFIRVAARGAIFDRADARECTFISAGLFEASFQEARIENADLRGAHLFSANLYRTRMDGALLEGANLTRTYLDGKK